MTQSDRCQLIPPYGGNLVNLMADAQDVPELREYANSLPGIQLSKRSTCDLQLLASGAFSPLDRFVSSNDYRHILGEMRLASGQVFPIPVTLPVEPAPGLALDREVTLLSEKNESLAILRIEEIYPWSLNEEAQQVFGTTDPRHPLVAEMQSWGRICVSGSLRVLQSQRYFDFQDLRLAPSTVRERLQELGRSNVVAFQTRNPLHRAHEEMTKRAIDSTNGVLLLHPVVGLTKPGDIDHYTRVRTYKVMAERYYDRQRILLALIPLAMRLAGPREALWHALIRRNYGANHLIVGRDHASPGHDSSGRPFYEPYAAQNLAEQFGRELGVKVIRFDEMVYWPAVARYEEASSYPASEKPLILSGTKAREDYLDRGRLLPGWFARPEVAQLLGETHPPRNRQGLCIWFTGLSSAGKSTTAEILTELLLEHGRQATLLDGDIVRTQLSQGLGFSKEDRDTNIRRIGFVASEVVRHGGIAVCAAVSPYRATRDDVRNAMGVGHFLEVYVNTPLEICELRDPKGIYARARKGEMKNVTGIDDPYEEPCNPEVTLDTVGHTAEENARQILHRLIDLGFVTFESAKTPDKSDAGDQDAPVRHHAIITGTGRAGTTFLMQLLTALGRDTGFADPASAVDPTCNAGMELDIREPNSPYIIKSPWLCDYLDEVLDQGTVVIDHAIIPVRDLFAAAESRRDVMRRSSSTLEAGPIAGGLWHTRDGAQQESILVHQLYKIIHTLGKRDIPLTLIFFPRMVHDPQYLFEKLHFLLPGVSYSRFLQEFTAVVRPELVHEFRPDGAVPNALTPK